MVVVTFSCIIYWVHQVFDRMKEKPPLRLADEESRNYTNYKIKISIYSLSPIPEAEEELNYEVIHSYNMRYNHLRE